MARRLLVHFVRRVDRRVFQAQLGAGDRLPLAGRAELLPVSGRTGRSGGTVQRVIETELPEPELEVVHVHPRREALAATGTARALPLLPHLLIQLHAELGRPLED